MNHSIYALLVFIITISFSNAQDNQITLNQDPKFEKLLSEKRKINNSIGVTEYFKIQIFNGDAENAKKTLNGFKKDFIKFDGTIVFSTPTYKVLVGNFKTRIEAEKNLTELKKEYKNAIIIKPSK